MQRTARETMMLGIMVKCWNGEESFGTEITGTLMIFIGSMTQQAQHGLFGATKDA
jgi:hypothetical protein